MKSRFGVAMLALLAGLGLGVFLGVVVPRLVPRETGRYYNTSTILRQVQALSELVTMKYVLEKIIVIEDVKWYGESRVLFLANGVVKAGIDLSELRPGDIRITGKKISIKLPMERVTDAYLDDKKSGVIERTTGLVRSFDKDIEQKARQRGVEDIRRGAREMGILKEAREKAQLQLKVLFLELGFSQVEFEGPGKK